MLNAITTETLQGATVLMMFIWSLINVVHYYMKTRTNLHYMVAFSLALMYQIAFYVLYTANKFGIFIKPYPDYFTDMSFKRNLLFAVLSTLVSLNLVVQERYIKKHDADER